MRISFVRVGLVYPFTVGSWLHTNCSGPTDINEGQRKQIAQLITPKELHEFRAKHMQTHSYRKLDLVMTFPKLKLSAGKNGLRIQFERRNDLACQRMQTKDKWIENVAIVQ